MIGSTPNALCFFSELSAAGVPCHIGSTSAGLTIQFPDSSNETVPFAALSIGVGGFDHDQLVIQWIDNGRDRTVYVQDSALLESLRSVLPAELIGALDETAQRVRAAQHRRRTVLWIIGASILALLIAGWMAFDSVVGLAVDRIPVQWEQRIGEAARHNLLAGQTVITDGAAVEATKMIARRLTEPISSSPYRFEITVVKSDVVNAMALPGGTIVVFTGLLKEAESPEEVAGVLAHEISHVRLRHGLHGTVKSLGVLIVVQILVGQQQGLIGMAERLGLRLTRLQFSRRMETEADLAGLDLLSRARLSAAGMIRFFERLSEKDTRQIDLLSTHPMSAERAARVKSRAAGMGAQPDTSGTPIEVDWIAVKASL